MSVMSLNQPNSHSPGTPGIPAPPAHPVPRKSLDEPLIAPMCAIFRRFLKHKNLKFTPERALILDAVLSRPGIFEADELLFDMRKSGRRVSKATIYRTLKHLLEASILTEVLLDSKQAHYQLGFDHKPRGHLVCVDSNRVVEFECPELLELRDRICKKLGFNPVSHRFVIYGSDPQMQTR